MLLHSCNQYYTIIQPSGLDSELHWWTATVYKSFTMPGVPLFVILSGALLLQSSKLNEPIRVFLKKRFNRIGVAFIFWSLIYIAWGFFVTETPPTLNNVIDGVFYSFISGSYYHFWFLYLIIGLYLVTPVLRAVVAYDSHKLLRYLIILWFIGVAVVPIVKLVGAQYLSDTLFVIGGSIGYFVLGAYLQRIRVRSSILYALFFLSFGFTIFGTWLMRFHFQSLGQEYFFFDYLSANVILTSVVLFMILSKFPADWAKNKHSLLGRVVHEIGRNTLPIYLFHIIILETLQRGYLGFSLSLTTMNPIIGVPIVAAVTFFITFGLVLVMKKVPVLRKLIG